mgnify:CR=1 FL=1
MASGQKAWYERHDWYHHAPSGCLGIAASAPNNEGYSGQRDRWTRCFTPGTTDTEACWAVPEDCHIGSRGKCRVHANERVHDAGDTQSGVQAGNRAASVVFGAAPYGLHSSAPRRSLCLLLGYYTDYSGRIRIDGQDLRELNVLEIRRLVGVVAQDPFLFDGTVADNLELAANGRMGGFAGRTGRIDQAVRQNRVLERLLSRLPEGLATKVGEGGRNLPGGQRQTVAIARAFLRCARIVVFDEATAHLDSEAHAVVEEAVQELFSDRLCIVLTHDPGLARIARQRVRMNQGRVVDID